MLPLGQRHVFSSGVFWLGLFYVCFPLGLLLYELFTGQRLYGGTLTAGTLVIHSAFVI